MEGSEPASLLIPVRTAATPGTGMCDTGLWLTLGEGTAQGAKPRESCPGGKDQVEWECGSGAGVQSHVLLGNWAGTAAEGSQVNTVSMILTWEFMEEERNDSGASKE